MAIQVRTIPSVHIPTLTVLAEKGPVPDGTELPSIESLVYLLEYGYAAIIVVGGAPSIAITLDGYQLYLAVYHAESFGQAQLNRIAQMAGLSW